MRGATTKYHQNQNEAALGSQTEAARGSQDQTTREPFVSVQDVCKSYGSGEGKAQVLQGLSLEVARGELCAILGASGSGKSTLLNVVGGLDEVDSGRICVGGCDVTALGPSQLLEYRRDFLGFVFQFYNLVPNLTVRENIQITSYLSANPLDMQELIETLGLSAHADKFPSQLSGGQQQRCAIGRAPGQEAATAALRRADRRPRLCDLARDTGSARAGQQELWYDDAHRDPQRGHYGHVRSGGAHKGRQRCVERGQRAQAARV